MPRKLRIVVADDEPDMQEFFKTFLPRMGHELVSVCQTGTQLVHECRAHRPDLVITDIKMPDMDGIAAAEQIYRDGAIPVILVSAHHDEKLIARAQADHIMAYLIKPIRQADLEPAIALATQRFAQFEALRREAADLRQALKDRKIIERAKGILMRSARLSEPDAFRRLQKLASDKNRKMVDIAEMVVLADEAMTPADSNS